MLCPRIKLIRLFNKFAHTQQHTCIELESTDGPLMLIKLCTVIWKILVCKIFVCKIFALKFFGVLEHLNSHSNTYYVC